MLFFTSIFFRQVIFLMYHWSQQKGVMKTCQVVNISGHKISMDKVTNKHYKVTNNNFLMMKTIHTRRLTWNLKMMVSKRNLLFQGPNFRFHVSFPGCSRFVMTNLEKFMSFWDFCHLTPTHIFGLFIGSCGRTGHGSTSQICICKSWSWWKIKTAQFRRADSIVYPCQFHVVKLCNFLCSF